MDDYIMVQVRYRPNDAGQRSSTPRAHAQSAAIILGLHGVRRCTRCKALTQLQTALQYHTMGYGLIPRPIYLLGDHVYTWLDTTTTS